MKLYYSPGACSLSPHIVLREAGAAFDLEKVDLRAKKTEKGADFTQINPKGYVPVLELDDGSVLTEGPAIVQYVADAKGANGLVPKAGTPARYHLQEWLNFITSELHKGFSPLFWPNTPDAFKDIMKQRLAGRFAFLDKHLAKNQYLMGDHFTVADAYCYVTLTWAPAVNIDLAPYKNLSAYRDRIAARPAVQAARQAEGLK
ncbi:MAG: glutathione transferase GstA [Alphaproteobacteria bacterium]